MKRVLLKKYQIIIMIIIQIIVIIKILHGITEDNIVYRPALRSDFMIVNISEIILVLVLIGSYIFLAKKYWNLKEYFLRYRIFSILNIVYTGNILLNLIVASNIEKKRVFRTSVVLNIGIAIFLILNLILFITYNRNLKALENKDKLDK